MQKEIRARLDSLPKTEASFVEPMECLSVSKLPEGLEWLWEIKLDGYRALAVKAGTGVTLFSRRRKSLNRQFPYIVEALADLPAGTVVDGEVVAIDESGRPDFNLLQHFRADGSRIQYYIFDLLCWKDRDLMRVPLVERRALLKSVVVILEKRIRIADYFEAAPNDLLAAVREQGLEGIIGKRKDSLSASAAEIAVRTGSLRLSAPFCPRVNFDMSPSWWHLDWRFRADSGVPGF